LHNINCSGSHAPGCTDAVKQQQTDADGQRGILEAAVSLAVESGPTKGERELGPEERVEPTVSHRRPMSRPSPTPPTLPGVASYNNQPIWINKEGC